MAGATVTNNQATFATPGAYVQLPSGLFGSYTAVSVEAWLTTGINNPSEYTRIFEFGSGTGSPMNCIEVSGPDIFYVSQFGDGTGVGCSSSVSFNSQTNLHVVVTVSEGEPTKMYINGVLQCTIGHIFSQIPSPNYFYIGRSIYLSSHDGLIGSVDQLLVWGGALSADDVASLYLQGK